MNNGNNNINKNYNYLLENHILLQTIINFLPDPTFTIDTKGKVTLWNKAIEELTGIKASDIIGKGEYEHSSALYGRREPSLIDLAIGDTLKQERTSSTKYSDLKIKNDNCFYDETICLMPDGNTGCFLIKASPLYNSKGTLVGAIAHLKDVSQARAYEEKFKQLRNRDYLTGLFSHSMLEEELRNPASEKDLPLSIIRIEINGLKLINDTFGYHQGDNLIVGGAKIIKRICQDNAAIYRWNGNGFVIILPATDHKTSLQICLKIKDACRDCDDYPINLSISCGTATKTEVSEDINKVIKKAEMMMQRNKSVISKELQLNIIAALQKLLEAKSEETIDHAFRININSIRIGKIIGLTDIELHELALLAALHDVGKIAIPDSIILKKEKLTPEEWEIMKKHSEIGYNLTQSIPELYHISDKILHHHEWWNGEGYPDGLSGEEIPLLSRVIAVVDAYDVMTSGRSYKKSFSHKKALGELQKFSGIHFDPHLVDIFIEIQEQNNHKKANQPDQSSSGGEL